MARYSPTHPRSWALYARRAGLAVALLLLLAACAPATRPTTPSPTATPPGDARTVYVGADGVYALRPSDGAVRWRYTVGAHPAAWVAGTVADGAVVATVDRVLVALDAGSGAVRWRRQDEDRAFWQTPLVAGGVVYTAFAHAADRSFDAVAALDARDGTLRWEFRAGAALLAAPTLADGALYVGTADSDLYALRASDGALLWRRRLADTAGGGIAARVAEAGGLVYVGASVPAGQDPGAPWRNYLAALRASDGSVAWRTQVNTGAEGAVVEPAAVGGGVAYASVEGGDVDALDARTGAPVWHTHIDIEPVARAGYLSPPTLAGGALYLGADGALYALDPRDGAVLWHAPANDPDATAVATLAPVAADGAVYAASCDCPLSVSNPPGGLGAYDAATGASRWYYRTNLEQICKRWGRPAAPDPASVSADSLPASVTFLSFALEPLAISVGGP